MLTRGAVAVDSSEDVADLGQAAVWGLLRSAQTENPGRILLADVDDWASTDVAVAEMASRDESQLAVRNGVCFVPRLVRAEGIDGAELVETGKWRLATLGDGTLDSRNFALRPWSESKRRLGPGEVRLGLRCSGVNFHDVLTALGHPSELRRRRRRFWRRSRGRRRCARVRARRPSDGPVLRRGTCCRRGSSDGSRASLRGGPTQQAATVPAVFLTAYYALAHAARVSAGERVLIHAATGGVGMAAVQLAKHWALDVYATASPGKWGVLRNMGFDEAHIANSRTLEFEQKFSLATGGAGMNVVLDCLKEEFVDASLRLLSRGGRFIELGKADIRDPEEVATRHPGVRYRAFDLLHDVAPELLQEMLRSW